MYSRGLFETETRTKRNDTNATINANANTDE